ncbi:MAG: ATP-NAD kinase family protein [Woeseiaceae bacterium]
MHTIGLIVNPVAGMGGTVGLKGTDGAMHEKALSLGAKPVSPARTNEFLTHITCSDLLRLFVAPGRMGADHAAAAGMNFDVVGNIGEQPGPGDTRKIARKMIDAGAELIVFAGGDGTARDIVDAVGLRVPVIAIPSGVKVYSSVFAVNPRAAAALLDAFIDDPNVGEEEVLDIDEDAFRDGKLDSRHYGFLLVPEVGDLLQAGKESSGTRASTAEAKRAIATAVVDEMQSETLYLLGPGTTVQAIADELGVEKTLLGVDAVVNGKLVGQDMNERSILELLDSCSHAIIVVTPLGGNGFIFGRGNKQFSPQILQRVGRDNIIIVANKDKLMKFTALHIDTGDPEVDAVLAGYIDVVVAPGHTKVMRVR